MVAATFGVASVDLRRAAEFARDEDRGRIEQTLLLQAGEQRRQTRIEFRAELVLKLGPVVCACPSRRA